MSRTNTRSDLEEAERTNKRARMSLSVSPSLGLAPGADMPSALPAAASAEEEEEDDFLGEDGFDSSGSDDAFDDDDMASDDDSLDFGVEEEAAAGRAQAYTVADIRTMMDEMEERFSEVSGRPRATATSVLAAWGWKLDECLALCIEDPERLYAKVGDPSVTAPADSGIEPECVVCMDDLEGPELAAHPPMACGHVACASCWSTYCQSRVMESREGYLTCLGTGCHLAIPNERVLSLLDEQHRERLLKQQVEAFVGCNSALQWCPTPSCGSIVTTDGESPYAECPLCLATFCFSCGEDHGPATCKMVRQFEALCAKDGGNFHWLASHTKECPRCAAYIEKNGGCNWIKCAKCKFEFCWLCGRHMLHSEVGAAGGSHKCNVFKEGEALAVKARKEAKDRAVKQMEHRRVAHHHGRCTAHKDSAKLEAKLVVKFRRIPASKDHAKKLLMEAEEAGLSRLATARRTLWNSYIFAFYQVWDKTNSRKEVFEGLQHLLENRTEALSKALEISLATNRSKMADELAMKHREDVRRNTSAVKNNQENLVDVCSGDFVREAEEL